MCSLFKYNTYLSLLNAESINNIPSEVPTRIAVGVARPSAQGQETTYKSTKTICKKNYLKTKLKTPTFIVILHEKYFFRNNAKLDLL